jgi:hypothetical protein
VQAVDRADSLKGDQSFVMANWLGHSAGRSGEVTMGAEEKAHDWEWPLAPSSQQHPERVALLRQIPYEISPSLYEELPEMGLGHRGKALSLNICSGGILLLMNHEPEVHQVMKVQVPTPVNLARTPTLAEVRWVRKVPYEIHDGLYFVGVKFVL